MSHIKLLFFFIYTFTLNTALFTQETEIEQDTTKYGWKNELIGNLNLTQASFDNWEQGGENTLAWQITLNINFSLDQEKYNWSNSGKFSLGFAKVGDSGSRKSADEIKLESVYTRKLNKSLNPFVAVTAKTQFAAGFDYDSDTKSKVSRFMDPGYFTQSAGVGYSPHENLKSRLGATIKETITSDFPKPFADNPSTIKTEKTKVEPGISSITEYKKKFEENIIFASKLDLFSDLEAFDRIDVLWENNLILKFSNYINVSVNVDLFYDKDISDRRQIKQVLAIGLTYTFL